MAHGTVPLALRYTCARAINGDDGMASSSNQTLGFIHRARKALEKIVGNTLDIFTLRKRDIDEAQAVARVISKLSPFTANVMEPELAK